MLTVLAELGTVNVRRVYGNWSKPALKGWSDMSIKHGIEPQQQFDLTKGKNATDMKMTIDAMDLLFRGRIDGFGIMSSDSDFMPLATRIRQDGSRSMASAPAATPEGVPPGLHAVHRRRRAERDVAADARAAPPAPVGWRAAALRRRRSPRPKTAQPIDEQVIKLLIDAYNAVKRDEKGYVSLSPNWASSPATGRASTRATTASTGCRT